MPFKLSEAVIPHDHEALFATEWQAWTHPRNAMWEFLSPVLESGPDAEAHAIAAASARQLKATLEDPADHWLKVVDTETGTIVGGALWKIYETNPYRAPVPPVDVSWWPEGDELRDLTNALFEQFNSPRVMKMQVPHVYLKNLFTHSENRSRGVGSMCVEWGVRKADELGLETYVESSAMARRLYESHGFVHVDTVIREFRSLRSKPSEELMAMPTAIMWRPVGGKYEKGKTVIPWVGKPLEN